MRPIDADALKVRLSGCMIMMPNGEKCTAERAIDTQGTIQHEQRCGEWIIKPHGTYHQLRAYCSYCGKHSGIGGIISNQLKPYCPNCGAEMKVKKCE